MAVRLKRWSREEYHRLAAAGFFGDDDRFELIDGEIVEMVPIGPKHAGVTTLVGDALRSAVGPSYHIRDQNPLALTPYSEPQPDVAVVAGGPRDYLDGHPASAVLVVEVADTTGSYDRERKGPLYAAAGIPEYWIVDLPTRTVEVYRAPERRPDGWAYGTRLVAHPGETLTPASLPHASVRIDDLLP